MSYSTLKSSIASRILTPTGDCHGHSTFETLDWYWRSVFVSMLGGGAAAASLRALASHTLCIENLTADRTTQKMLVSVLILPASFPASYYGAERFKYPRLQRTTVLVEFHQYICADVGNCTATTPRFTSDQLTTRSDLKRVEVRHRIASHPGCCRPPPIRPTD
jgi:hypothetical protein